MSGDRRLITLFVESLTGTIFEVHVSPNDTVESIKLQIQKKEGIPIIHQHLVFNANELENTSKIDDPVIGLQDESTLRLILSLKGGPISLVHQKVPFNSDFLQKLQLNSNFLEKDTPSGSSKHAIFIIKAGDRLSFLQIIDDESDDDFEKPQDQSLEYFKFLQEKKLPLMTHDSATNEKVRDLKSRLKDLSLRKKPMKVDLKEKNADRDTKLQKPNEPPNSSNTSIKLYPVISQSELGEKFNKRSDFSKIPILPNITQPFKKIPRMMKCLSLDIGPCTVCKNLRPKTCPPSLHWKPFPKMICTSYNESVGLPFRLHTTAKNELKEDTSYKHCLPPLKQTLHQVTNNLNLDNRIFTAHQSTPYFFQTNSNLYRTDKLSSSRDNSDPELRGSSQKCLKPLIPPNTKKLSSESTATPPLPAETFNLTVKMSGQKKNKMEHINKSRLKCSECKKKLTLINKFECRCGYTFCSNHRYSETHKCTYDFKAEGRKLIEETNPSILAPKLTKF